MFYSYLRNKLIKLNDFTLIASMVSERHFGDDKLG
jgi:hypothetical protein